MTGKVIIGGKRNGKKGKFTNLIKNKRYAQAEEKYISTKRLSSKKNILEDKFTSKGTAVSGSWDVPDIRVYGILKKKKFKKAYLVNRNLDKDSRIAMLVPDKKDAEMLKSKIKGKIKKVLVQDYNPTEHSFYKFIGGQ